MSKPKSSNLKVLLISQLALLALLFPALAAGGGVWAADGAVSPSASSDISTAPSISASPSETPPIVCGESCFNPSLYSIDSADSLWVVVNKTRKLNPKKYAPVLDETLPLAVPAAKAYRKLRKAMKAGGIGTLCLNSGYRSFATQKNTHAYQVARGKQYGYDGETVAARPGFSEHQTGLAADVSTTELGCSINKLRGSTAAKWLQKKSWEFGFVIRYRKNQQDTTGYIHEPWHLRFVGIELATQMHLTKAKSLEEFWQLPAAPNYILAATN